jgi:hypothetical protein
MVTGQVVDGGHALDLGVAEGRGTRRLWRGRGEDDRHPWRGNK